MKRPSSHNSWCLALSQTGARKFGLIVVGIILTFTMKYVYNKDALSFLFLTSFLSPLSHLSLPSLTLIPSFTHSLTPARTLKTAFHPLSYTHTCTHSKKTTFHFYTQHTCEYACKLTRIALLIFLNFPRLLEKIILGLSCRIGTGVQGGPAPCLGHCNAANKSSLIFFSIQSSAAQYKWRTMCSIIPSPLKISTKHLIILST